MTSDPNAEALRLYRLVIGEMSEEGRTLRLPEVETALTADLQPEVRASLLNLLTHVRFQASEYEKALTACRQWLKIQPDNATALDSELSILVRLHRYEEMIEAGEGRLPNEPDNYRLLSSLANANGKLGNVERACELGELTLESKDRSAVREPLGLGEVDVPEFDGTDPEANIIAFSLYGSLPKYCEGALRNVDAARHIYPEWTCRIYVDESVPQKVRDELNRRGAQVKLVAGLPAGRFGTFWRFLVADDPAVERYLVRDCDACVNLRERAAVEDWIESGKHFHIMRDGLTHTELVLAGMWGGVGCALPNIVREISEFAATAQLSRTADQTFLRERLWPTIRQSVLAHDSHFQFAGATGFPRRANIPGIVVGRAV